MNATEKQEPIMNIHNQYNDWGFHNKAYALTNGSGQFTTRVHIYISNKHRSMNIVDYRGQNTVNPQPSPQVSEFHYTLEYQSPGCVSFTLTHLRHPSGYIKTRLLSSPARRCCGAQTAYFQAISTEQMTSWSTEKKPVSSISFTDARSWRYEGSLAIAGAGAGVLRRRSGALGHRRESVNQRQIVRARGVFLARPCREASQRLGRRRGKNI